MVSFHATFPEYAPSIHSDLPPYCLINLSGTPLPPWIFLLLPFLRMSFFFFLIPFSLTYSSRFSSDCKGSLECPSSHHTCEMSTCQTDSRCSWEGRHTAFRSKSQRAAEINCKFAGHIGRSQRLCVKLMDKYLVFKDLKQMTRNFWFCN